MKRFVNINKIDWVCHHLHIDKSRTVNKDNFYKSLVHMKEKWLLMRDIKKNYTKQDLNKRMFQTTHNLVEQDCKRCVHLLILIIMLD